jgi:glucose-1-phosphate thymidylyltransferase
MAGKDGAAVRTGVILGGEFGVQATVGINRLPALAPVANKPIVCHALEVMAGAGIEDVAIVTNPESRSQIGQAIADGGDCGLHLAYVEVPESVGYAQAVLAAAEFVDRRPFVFHRGDGLFRSSVRPLVKEFENAKLDALVLVQRGAEPLPRLVTAADRQRAAPLPGAALSSSSERVLAGVHAFGPRFLEALGETKRSSRGSIEIGRSAGRLAAKGGRVVMRPGEWWWSCDGTPGQLLRTNRLVLDELSSEFEGVDLLDSRIEGRVSIHPSATLIASTIRGPAIIGPRACLSHAYVGPYTSIAAGVAIEGAEIEDSIIFPDVVIRYLGRRLEGSVVGSHAKLHRDFSLPTALRLWVGDNVEVSLG